MTAMLDEITGFRSDVDFHPICFQLAKRCKRMFVRPVAADLGTADRYNAGDGLVQLAEWMVGPVDKNIVEIWTGTRPARQKMSVNYRELAHTTRNDRWQVQYEAKPFEKLVNMDVAASSEGKLLEWRRRSLQ
ncbi:hypothetical protein B0H17DRAFT_1145360 [Mycena rosella]|uniref:Uncharacterized protein n=1 Tax=Mycena rosella TaxID=1033263 RepID=A0AAD7CRB9_MYCRO|nr:hypothetical protein B0H17DRAFT_1145360 [Mycena rosella]